MAISEIELAQKIRQRNFSEADKIVSEMILTEFKERGIQYDERYPISSAFSKIPAQYFINIDKIWMNETDGLFGFSRQALIYEACNKNWEQFCISIGWMSEQSLLDGLNCEPDKYKKIKFSNWVGQYPIIVDTFTILFHDTWNGDPISIQKYLMSIMSNYYGEKLNPLKKFWIE